MDDSHVFGLLHGCEESLSVSSDRLSELPDSLILEILSLLPMKDVVKTTLLSKRWKDLWTTVPCLDFSNIPTATNLYKFRRFVCGALALWKGVKILKFSLSLCQIRSYNSFGRDILDSWLHFALEKQVEDINIGFEKYISSSYFQPEYYYVPEFLHSCSSIKKLSLVSCKLNIDKNVQWNQLKSLTIEGLEPLSVVSLNHILSGAPHLEVLKLTSLVVRRENLIINIRSTSLKMLKLKIQINTQYIPGFLVHGADDTMLRIWAPNLDTLKISGLAYGLCVLDVPSLTTAILDFRDVYMWLRETLNQVLASILHVRKLTLSYSCIDQINSTVEVPEPFMEISLNPIFSGAPNLEVLNLSLHNKQNLNIHSTSLKMLKINRSSYTNTVLRIRAPNLETLEISGFPNRNCLLHVPSLTNAILVFHVDISLRQMLERIFESILHVEKLTLSDLCTEVLLKMKKKYKKIPSNAKFLKLYASAPNKIIGVVKMFPHLTMLLIECDTEMMTLRAFEESGALDSKKSFRLLHLKTIEITWCVHDPSIELEFF